MPRDIHTIRIAIVRVEISAARAVRLLVYGTDAAAAATDDHVSGGSLGVTTSCSPPIVANSRRLLPAAGSTCSACSQLTRCRAVSEPGKHVRVLAAGALRVLPRPQYDDA
jgi:hypothetical protein